MPKTGKIAVNDDMLRKHFNPGVVPLSAEIRNLEGVGNGGHAPRGVRLKTEGHKCRFRQRSTL